MFRRSPRASSIQSRISSRIRQTRPSLEALEDRLAPAVALQNTITTLAENISTTAPVKVAEIVVADTDPAAATLSLAGADASLFEIGGAELFLKAGAALDFETNPALDVTVNLVDAAPEATPESAALSIAISNVNEAPVMTLQAVLTSLDETPEVRPYEDYHTSYAIGISSSVTVYSYNPGTKVADILIADDALGYADVRLSGPDARYFHFPVLWVTDGKITRAELFLDADAPRDFERKATYSVTVEVDDIALGDGPDSSATFILSINDVNEKPIVGLKNFVAGVNENTTTPSPVRIADIYVIDDALGEENLRLAGADTAFFEIVDNQLFMKAGTTLDFETKRHYQVIVVAVDIPGDWYTTATLNLWLTDVNEKPTVQLKNLVPGLLENTTTASPFRVADISVTDDALGKETFSLSEADAAFFEIAGNQLFVKAGTTLDFETKPYYRVTVVVDDPEFPGAPDTIAPFELWLTDAPDPNLRITTVRARAVAGRFVNIPGPYLKRADAANNNYCHPRHHRRQPGRRGQQRFHHTEAAPRAVLYQSRQQPGLAQERPTLPLQRRRPRAWPTRHADLQGAPQPQQPIRQTAHGGCQDCRQRSPRRRQQSRGQRPRAEVPSDVEALRQSCHTLEPHPLASSVRLELITIYCDNCSRCIHGGDFISFDGA